jgi:pimeloyl-ACP methyl ester carboxylesterase
MERKNFPYKNSLISFLHFGIGPNIAVCFHGYGEDASSFGFLDKYAGNQYTFYAIELPFHGQTEWNEGLLFSLEDLLQIISTILRQNPGQDPENEAPLFSLVGFSLGGRAALALYQAIPHKIEKLILLAPDGLKVNAWYRLATQTWLGNRFFSFTMKKPGWFFGMLKVLNKLKLVNASIFKFVNFYIGDAEVRKQLYTRWTTLRKLKPGLQKIKQQITHHQTPVRLLYGKHDRIILSSVGEKFQKGIEPYCTLTVLHSGHQVLHEKHSGEIIAALDK